ncbi:MAG: hypothetical protein LBL04_02090 [Bacteroidales bacterium]|jgi:hypothetical protein|nr:hypothetical protein [Bacteroidales bacterium]
MNVAAERRQAELTRLEILMAECRADITRRKIEYGRLARRYNMLLSFIGFLVADSEDVYGDAQVKNNIEITNKKPKQ